MASGKDRRSRGSGKGLSGGEWCSGEVENIRGRREGEKGPAKSGQSTGRTGGLFWGGGQERGEEARALCGEGSDGDDHRGLTPRALRRRLATALGYPADHGRSSRVSDFEQASRWTGGPTRAAQELLQAGGAAAPRHLGRPTAQRTCKQPRAGAWPGKLNGRQNFNVAAAVVNCRLRRPRQLRRHR